MKATFIELPPFARHQQHYLSDNAFRKFQLLLLQNPEAGDVIEGCGGLCKVRYTDQKRGKGKRGGLRIIYFWWATGQQFWLFTLYNKNEMADLSPSQCKILETLLKQELQARINK